LIYEGRWFTFPHVVRNMKLKPYPIITFLLLGGLVSAQGVGAEDLGLNFEAPQLEKTSLDERVMSFSGNMRTIGLLSQKPLKDGNKSGIALMTATLGIEVNPIPNMSAVIQYDLGFFSPGVRDLYAAFSLPENAFVESITVGQFRPPLGLLTSEHRIYMKRFLGGSINDYDVGLKVSGSRSIFSYDLALVAGEGSGKRLFSDKWSVGIVPNIQIEIIPEWRVGMSAYFYNEKKIKDKQTAVGQDGELGTQLKVTEVLPNQFSHFILSSQLDWKKLEWTAEIATGHIRNIAKFGRFFKSDAFLGAIKGKQTVSLYNTIAYRFFNTIKGFYRLDAIAFDMDYLGDLFLTHTLGVEYRFLAFASIDMRMERNIEGRKVDPILTRNNDSIMAMLHVWF